MLTWRDELVSDIHTELGAKPIIATLATVNGNRADARSVVIRQVHADGTLRIASDSRSEKNHQLRSNHSAALIIWFPQMRKQYRVSGDVQVVSNKTDPSSLRPAAWHELSDSARALFHWPPCGMPLTQDGDFPQTSPADAPVPDNFELLLLSPATVETLETNSHPHRRVRWTFEFARWKRQEVNP